MATTTLLNNERHLISELGRALAALEEKAGVQGRLVANEPGAGNARRAGAEIDIYADGKRHRYAVEAKTRVDRLVALGHIKAQLDRLGRRALLFAPYITPTIARHCRKLDIPFMDIAGNAYLHEPGLHVYITGEKPAGLRPANIATRGAGTATALRVVFALLCKPALLNAPYREIVDAAKVALGAIGWVFIDLEARGYIAGRPKKRNRRFLEPERLFEEWVTTYPMTLRPKLNPRRFRAETPQWWKNADLTGLDAYWGGEIAAQRLTRHLKPATCTLYMQPDDEEKNTRRLAKLVAANRLRADPQGDIEILDTFWNLPAGGDNTDVVPPILVYADLIATLDPRNLEVAGMIREKHIENALRKA